MTMSDECKTGLRGAGVVLQFSCEGCARPFELIFQQRKGNTSVYTRIVVDGCSTPDVRP